MPGTVGSGFGDGRRVGQAATRQVEDRSAAGGQNIGILSRTRQATSTADAIARAHRSNLGEVVLDHICAPPGADRLVTDAPPSATGAARIARAKRKVGVMEGDGAAGVGDCWRAVESTRLRSRYFLPEGQDEPGDEGR